MASFANLAPRYLIKVQGTELREDVTRFINSVEFLEQENSAARISVDVANPDFRFLESKTFAEGNAIDLWMGYVDRPLAFMGRGFIVKPNPRFPRRGMPTMRIVAHDVSRKLMDAGEKDRGKVYKKKSDSEIAESIFKEIEAAPFTFATKGRRGRVRKRGVTRWQFLVKLARLHGYVVFVKYDPRKKAYVGYFGPPDVEDQAKKFRLSYGTGEQDATLLEFFSDVDLSGQSTKLEMTWTNPKTRKTQRLEIDVKRKTREPTLFEGAEGTREIKEPLTSGPSVTFTIFGQRTREVVGRSFKSVTDAKRFAAAWFQGMQDEFALGRGVILGNENVRRGQVHELAGIGARLSGDWHFTSAAHRMSGGIYETSISARRVVLENVLGAPAGVAKVKHRETDV